MMMVLSASSVYAFVRFDDAYYFVKRQVVFLVVGGVAAFVLARRSPQQLKVLGWVLVIGCVGAADRSPSRRWATPTTATPTGCSSAVVLPHPAVRAGQAGHRGVGRRTSSPASTSCSADPRHLLIPFLPVSLLLIGLVVLQSDLGTGHDHGRARAGRALVRRRVLEAARPAWWAAVAARGRWSGRHLEPPDEPDPRLLQPGPRPARRQPPADQGDLRARLRRLVGARPRRQPAEVGRPGGVAHRLHARRHRRGTRPGRHPARAGAVPDPRLRAASGSRCAPTSGSVGTPPPGSPAGS